MSIRSGFSRLAALLAAALAGLILAGPLAAQQTPGQPQVITLEDAVRLALERSVTVRQAVNQTRNAALNVSQQKRQLLPRLSLSTGSSVPYGVAQNATDPNVTAGVSASMNLGNFYSVYTNLRTARLSEESSELNLDRTQQTTIFNVISSYISLIEAQEQVAVQERNLAAVQAQQAQVERFVEAQRRPSSDLFQQQATTASAELSLVQARRGVVVAQMNMIRTLQLDPNGDYTFVAPEIGASTRTFASLNLDELTEQALAQRPDLKSSEISVVTAEQGIRTASATRWPSLSLTTGYNSGNFNSNSRGGFVDQLDSGRRGNLSLNVSVPLVDFTYGITKERAQISLANARMNLENTRQTVAIEVRTAYLDLQLAEQALEVAQAQMVAADRALEMARLRYEVAAATLLELEQSQLAQLRASLSLVSARYDVIFQSRLFDYYLGNLRAEDVIR